MGYYTVAGNVGTTSSSLKSAAFITTGGRRDKVCEIVVGALANPNSTDTELQYNLFRTTAPGSATAFTPQLWDSADVASSATAGVNATTEPTYTSSTPIHVIPVNQRNTVRWVAVQESQMFIIPTTTSAGVALAVLSTTFAASVAGTLIFME